jgi:hypothetical protein
MKKNDILLILIPSFIFVLTWIGFSIYHNVITSTISVSLNEQITPITSTFDINTLNALKNRENISPLYSLSATSQNSPTAATSTASPIVIASPISTNSGSQTPIATNGGSLTQ